MTHSFDINFAALAEREQGAVPLDIVITPVDDFTGRVIQSGVTAEIPTLNKRAARSLSGHLVFERLHAAPQHVVHIDPVRAGYFAPDPVDVDMPQDRATRELRLIRRPDAVQDGDTMLVRGSVVTGGQPVEAQVVEGHVAGVAGPFRTRTDAKGNFALRLSPPPPILGSDTVPVPVTTDVLIRLPGTAVPDILLDDAADLQTWTPPLRVEIP